MARTQLVGIREIVVLPGTEKQPETELSKLRALEQIAQIELIGEVVRANLHC